MEESNNTNKQFATIVRKIQGEATEQIEGSKIKCFKIDSATMTFMDDTPYKDFFEAIINQEFFYVADNPENGTTGYFYLTWADVWNEQTGQGHIVLQRAFCEGLVEDGELNVYVEGFDIVAEDFDNVKIQWNDRFVISDSTYELTRPFAFIINSDTWETEPSIPVIISYCAEGHTMIGYVQDNDKKEVHPLHYLAGKNNDTFTFYYDNFDDSGVEYTRYTFTFSANGNQLIRTNLRANALAGYIAIGGNPAVGKIPVVKEMNSSGNTSLPRSWEFIDVPKVESPWELIRTYQVSADDELNGNTSFELAADNNLKPFELKKAIFVYECPKYTGSSNIPTTPLIQINSTEDKTAVPAGTLGIPSKSTKTIGYYEIELNGNIRTEKGFQKEVSDDTDIFSDNFSITLDNLKEYKTINNKRFLSITELGMYNTLVYPGCKYVIYGVRV